MMKNYFSTLILAFAVLGLSATDHTIVTSGLNYSPADLLVQVGDNVTIAASGSHPTAQVSQATWDSNGTTELAGGFGTVTSAVTFEITDTESIYYVCTSHVGAGMKGQITVQASSVTDIDAAILVTLGEVPVNDGALEYVISSETALGASFEVYSVNGQLMTSQIIRSSTGTLETPFAAGLYVAVIRSDAGEMLYRSSFSVD